MKLFCFAVGSFIVGLGGPTFAANLSAEDRKALDLTEQRYSAAYNAKDPIAWAANFTSDAIRVTPDGIAHGRSAIRKQAEEDIKAGAHALVAKMTFAVIPATSWLPAGSGRRPLGTKLLTVTGATTWFTKVAA